MTGDENLKKNLPNGLGKNVCENERQQFSKWRTHVDGHRTNDQSQEVPLEERLALAADCPKHQGGD